MKQREDVPWWKELETRHVLIFYDVGDPLCHHGFF
ncbi:unnamed protein product, partial [Vitis vinifera]|uniref:Uncharacterized protein n=1 Tax=Vitis vinifera TaxID=29760 RepID=D7UB28_VITVI